MNACRSSINNARFVEIRFKIQVMLWGIPQLSLNLFFVFGSLKDKSFKGEFCPFKALQRRDPLSGRTKRPISAKGWS